MKSQVQLLFVITQGHWGGAQKYVLDLVTSLSPATYNVSIAVGAEDIETFKQKIPTSVSLYPLTHLKRNISPLHDLLAIHELKKLYQKLQPDIVHLNSSKAGILGSLARTKNTKIVYTAHGWVFLEPLTAIRKTLYRLLEQHTATKKDAIIVLSEEDKTVATTKLHIAEQKLHTIPLGIAPITFLNRTLAREKISAYDPDIKRDQLWSLTIANHYTTKGLDILIDAISQLTPPQQNIFQSLIIGDGPERTHLKEKIKQHHLEHNIFLLPHISDAAQLLMAADLFILPSRKEGLPYTLLEALQAGIPLIATQVGGIPSLLQKNLRATLIPPENFTALQEALQKILTNPQNFQTLPTQNTKESTQDSLSQMVNKTTDLYSDLLQ